MSTNPPTFRTLASRIGILFFPLAALGRLPYAMTIVGVLTLVAAGRDSYAAAGSTAAIAGVAAAIMGPVIGMLADRFGQRIVLLIAGTANAMAILGLVWAVGADVSVIVVYLAGLLVGCTSPQVAPLSRARLTAAVRLERGSRKQLGAVMAYESALDETIFVLGPLAVGVIGAVWGTRTAMFATAAATLLFVCSFALHRSASLMQQHHEDGEPAPRSAVFAPRILLLVGGTFLLGCVFGASLTSLTAFMGERGLESSTGAVYATMAIGSAIFALSMGIMPTGFTLRLRWIVFALVLLCAASALPFVTTPLGMAFALLPVGVGIGPVLVTLYSLVAPLAPNGRSTTVMTLLNAGVGLGQALSSAVIGVIADAFGSSSAFFGVVVVAATLLLLSIVHWRLHGKGNSLITGPLTALGTDVALNERGGGSAADR